MAKEISKGNMKPGTLADLLFELETTDDKYLFLKLQFFFAALNKFNREEVITAINTYNTSLRMIKESEDEKERKEIERLRKIYESIGRAIKIRMKQIGMNSGFRIIPPFQGVSQELDFFKEIAGDGEILA